MSNTCDLLLLCTFSHTHPAKSCKSNWTLIQKHELAFIRLNYWLKLFAVCLILLSCSRLYANLYFKCMTMCGLFGDLLLGYMRKVWGICGYFVMSTRFFITRFPGCDNSHQQIASLFSPVALAGWEHSVQTHLSLALACRRKNIYN